MRYHLKERFFTLKDDFLVRDNRGEVVYRVTSPLISVGDRFHIYEHENNNEVLYIKEKVFTYQKQYMFYQGESEIATMVYKDEPDFINNFFEVSVSTGAVLQLRGNFKEWDFEIADQWGRIYGHISREFAFFGDNYTVDIPDGIDAPFILAIAIVLDEMREDHVKTPEDRKPAR